jgi:hypothetical protein
MAGARPLRDLRRASLKALHGLPLLRRTAMRLGLGGKPGSTRRDADADVYEG